MSFLRVVVVSVAVLVAVAVAGGIVLASIDQSALTERVVGRVVRQGSDTLGREITVEGARGHLLPSPRVTISGLAIAGRPGEPPLAVVDELEVRLRTWPLVRSLGKEVVIDSVAAVRPELNLVRDAEGWSFQELGAREGEPSQADGDEGARVTLGHVSVDDGTVHVIDRAGGDAESAVALTHLDLEAELPDGELSRLVVRAALARPADDTEQNLSVDLAIAPAAERRTVRGTIELRGAELDRLGVVPAGITRVLRGGRLDVDAEVAPRDDGRYDVRADLRLAGVQTRGGPARGDARVIARVDPASPAAIDAELPRVSVSGPGIDLAGSASFAGEPRVSFDLRGPLLDLDLLLAAMPEGERRDERAPVLPPRLRSTLAGSAMRGSLRIDRVVRGPLELHDLDARARLRGGVLELEEAAAGVYGGRIALSGSRVDLRPDAPEWALDARLEGVDLDALQQRTSDDRPLTGRLDATLDVAAAGAEWDAVRSSVHGAGTVRVHDGALTTGDLPARVAEVASQALQIAGRESGRVRAMQTGRTELRDVRVAFTVAGGWVVLRAPLTLEQPFGSARLDGRIGLDRRLELNGAVILSPDFVDEIAGVRPAGDIEVPLSVGGTLSDPAITIPADALAGALARVAVQEGARQLEREIGGRVQDEVEQRLPEGLRDLGRGLGIPGF